MYAIDRSESTFYSPSYEERRRKYECVIKLPEEDGSDRNLEHLEDMQQLVAQAQNSGLIQDTEHGANVGQVDNVQDDQEVAKAENAQHHQEAEDDEDTPVWEFTALFERKGGTLGLLHFGKK